MWDVGEATSVAHRSVSSDIPMLIYVGEYDAYGPLPVAEQAVASLSGSFLVDVPYQGHNVLGTHECYGNIRNTWIEDPPQRPTPAASRRFGQRTSQRAHERFLPFNWPSRAGAATPGGISGISALRHEVPFRVCALHRIAPYTLPRVVPELRG
jgi:hypothetical protein